MDEQELMKRQNAITATHDANGNPLCPVCKLPMNYRGKDKWACSGNFQQDLDHDECELRDGGAAADATQALGTGSGGLTQARIQIGQALGALGIEVTDEHVDQFTPMVRAFRIYIDREQRHQEVWRRSGWRGMLVDLRKKLDRLWGEWWNWDHDTSDERKRPEQSDLDSALDIINYTAFFIRQAEDGNRDGVWPWQ